MSVPKPTMRLTARAQRDYDDILLYTETRWDTGQADRYDGAIARGLSALLDNPRLGAARDRLIPGLRSYPVERHVLYYRLKGNVIEVVRILHASQDAAAAFHRPGGS